MSNILSTGTSDFTNMFNVRCVIINVVYHTLQMMRKSHPIWLLFCFSLQCVGSFSSTKIQAKRGITLDAHFSSDVSLRQSYYNTKQLDIMGYLSV